MFKPQGIFTALVTPMNQDETINYQELQNQVDRQIGHGAGGLFCLGTNGEFYALSMEEKITMLGALADQIHGRVPLIVNVGCVTTRDTITLAKEAAKQPVDALSVIVPYYAGLTQAQLYDHYVEVAQSVDIPIMIYNIPQRTGNAISIETVKALSKVDNIIGIKDSSGKQENIDALLQLSTPDFSLLVGTDSMILETLKNGGAGAVAGCANPFPKVMNGIYNNWLEGNLEQALLLQESIIPFRKTFSLGNPNSIVKRAVELMGYPVGPARLPAAIRDSEVDNAIVQSIKDVESLSGIQAT